MDELKKILAPDLIHSNSLLTQFEQPALAVRVEERVCEVVAVVLWDFKRLVLDALVQVLKRKQARKQMGGAE